MRKKGKLYTANKWNLPLFTSNKNLFYGGGNTWYSNFDWNSTFGSPTTNTTNQKFFSNAMSNVQPMGINVSGANATPNVPSKIELPENFKTPVPKTEGFNWGNFGKTAGGLASMIPENEMTIGNTTFKRGLWDAGDPLYYVAKGRESGVGNALGNLGVSVTKTGASSGMGWLALAGAGLKAAGDIDNAVAGTKTDEDTLDTLNRTTAALNSFNSEAGSYEGLVRPSGMANYQDVYEGPGKNADIWAGMIGYLATGIPWAGTAYARRSRKAREEAERKNNELRRDYENAQAWAENSYLNNVYNIQQDQMNNLLRNYSAYGGSLDMMPMYDDGMAAINYGFMTDYLNTKKKQAEQKDNNITNLFAGAPSTMFASGGKIHINPKNKGKFNATKKRTGKTTEELTHSKNPLTRKRAIFAQNARKWHHADGGPLFLDDTPLFAFGGDLQSHGSDFPTGLTHIDEGGSHEMNPNQGVQMGVDQNGVPNLVEEGETVFNDYVYSNRIMVDDDTKKRYGINKKRQITFAELSKKLEKEASERPNDPISQVGLNASMSDLADAQEAEKMRIEAERAKAAFDSLTPEEQTMLMANATQQGNINAYGGNLFAQGSEMESVLEDAHNRITEENIAWLKNRFPNLDDATILKVSDMMINKGAGGLSPEGSFKRLVPTLDFSVPGVQKFVKRFLDAGIDIDTALDLANSYVPDRLKNTVDSQNTKIKERIEKESVPVAKQTEQPEVTKDSTRVSTWQNMQAAMGAPNNNTASTTVQRIANTPLYNSYYANPDSSVVQPQVVEEIVEQVPSATPVVETVAATVSPVQQPIVNQAPATVANSDRNYYDYYRNGNRGYGETPTGFAVNDKGKASNYTNQYRDFVDNQLTLDSVRNWIENHPDDTSLKSYLANHSLDDLSLNDVRKGATDGVYGWMHNAADELWQRYNALPVEQKISAPQPSREPITNINVASANTTPSRETQVYIATDKGIIPVDPSTLDDSYTIEDFDGVRIARKAPQKVEETPAQTEEEVLAEETGIKPDLKKETYMGLFGPAVGLGMMTAGIGRPNYRELDAALASARTAPRRAGYATIGDYLKYTPMDVWAEQNRLDANTRAADRALMAGNSPSRYAGILANNYNAQLASGDLYRRALEYNEARKAQVADFNRGTNQYNADAFTRNSQFNAESANRANQFATSVGLNVAQQRMANEADWYNSLYGNVYGLFDRVNQWEKWKRDHNTIAKMAADGIFGTMSDNTNIGKGFIESKGGKLKKKRKNDLTL